MKELSAGRIWQCDEPEAQAICVASGAWREIGIRAVLCPAYNVNLAYHRDLAVLRLPVGDFDTLEPEFFEIAATFHRIYQSTLVHCHGGLNRSRVFAAALLVSEGTPIEIALEAARPSEMFGGGLIHSLRRWSDLRKV